MNAYLEITYRLVVDGAENSTRVFVSLTNEDLVAIMNVLELNGKSACYKIGEKKDGDE